MMEIVTNQVGARPALPLPTVVEPDSVWPDPVPIPSSLLAVDAFMEGMLPTGLRRWVVDIAERMNCPVNFVAVPAMIVAATLIGRRIGIRPEVHTDWTEAGNLWGVIVGVPGSLKSPAVREAFGVLHHLEAKAAEAFLLEMEELRPQQQLHEIMEQEVKRQARAKLKDIEDDPAAKGEALSLLRDLVEPATPRQIRYITNDATPEKLGELCRDNPQGLLLHRDELLTMFTDLDQEEKASGRGMIMGGWTGLDGYTYDRIGRGTVRVDAINLSLFGTTQPNRLTGYMRNSLRHHDDGMIQRVQLLVWPDNDAPWRKSDRRRDERARELAMECYNRLACIYPENFEAQVDTFSSNAIPYLRFAPSAQEQFDRWRERLEGRVRQPDLSPALKGHLAKYRGLAPRLALVCHLASGGVGGVSVEAWVMAEWWVSYLETHARRAYAAIDTDNTDVSQAIIRRLQKGDLPGSFTYRDIDRKGWSGLRNREQVERALQMLVEYDWLEKERVQTRGRPSWVYTANPKALKMLN